MRCGFRLISLATPLIALLSITAPSQAQPCLQWVRRNVAPDPATTLCIAFDKSRAELIAVAGSNDSSTTCWTWRWNGSTWDVLSTDGPPSRLAFAVAYDSIRGVIILFGGLSSASVSLNDTWEWNGASWSLVSTAGPSPRYNHSLCFDSTRGVTVLFGGASTSDTWEWNGTLWQQKSAIGPSPRSGAAMTFDATSGHSVLFGGNSGSVYSQETWTWNGSTWVLKTGTGPTARNFHSLAFDETRGVSVMSGGISSGGFLSDTWEWNGSMWLLRSTTSSKSAFASAAFDANTHQVVRMHNYLSYANGDVRSDLWKWDGEAWLVQNHGRPRSRAFPAMAYDSHRQRTVIFGGSAFGEAGIALNDTWEWDGNVWHSYQGPSPSARYGMPMAFDSTRNVCVVYGGTIGSGAGIADTWEWNGQVWTQRPGNAPGPLYNNSMVYDSLHNQTLMQFAVPIDSPTSGHLWAWNGAIWQLLSTNGPPRWWNRATSFDARRSRVVAFGGYDFVEGYTTSTFEWDMAQWSQHQPALTPTGRWRQATAFDSRRGVHMVFAGGQGHIYNNELWEWDGAEWTQLQVDGNIPPRGTHSMVYDSARNRIVVYGGILNDYPITTSFGDLWELDLSATPTAITHPASPSICAGGSVTLKSTFEGPSQFTYRWRKDGQWLTDDSHRIGTDSDTLVFITTNDTDTGTYECRAVNVCAQAFCKPATLTVFPINTADGNLDGHVDGRDIALFVNSIVNFAPVSAPLCAFDLTGEGVVSEADIPPFVAHLLIE